MSRRELELTVRLSVLDRLLDDEPGETAERAVTRSESIRLFTGAVLRDLEWLLNTRRISRPAPATLAELSASVYNFGIADITSLSRDSSDARQSLRRQIEECIRVFEPRLSEVQVRFPEGVDDQHQIRFVVDGLLLMDPDPERITFDTILDVGRGEFLLGDDAHA